MGKENIILAPICHVFMVSDHCGVLFHSSSLRPCKNHEESNSITFPVSLRKQRCALAQNHRACEWWSEDSNTHRLGSRVRALTAALSASDAQDINLLQGTQWIWKLCRKTVEGIAAQLSSVSAGETNLTHGIDLCRWLGKEKALVGAGLESTFEKSLCKRVGGNTCGQTHSPGVTRAYEERTPWALCDFRAGFSDTSATSFTFTTQTAPLPLH